MFPSSLAFRLSILLFNGVLREGSTCWFIKDLISSWSVHQDSFLRNSSFLHIVIRSAFFLPYYWRWYYAILDHLSSCFMFHMLLRMRYFKSINPFVGIILGYISPKTVPKDCCYLWCSYKTQVLLSSFRWNKFLVSLFIPIQFFFREWQVVTS